MCPIERPASVLGTVLRLLFCWMGCDSFRETWHARCGRRPICASAAWAPVPFLAVFPSPLSASATELGSLRPRRPVLSSTLPMPFVLGCNCHGDCLTWSQMHTHTQAHCSNTGACAYHSPLHTQLHRCAGGHLSPAQLLKLTASLHAPLPVGDERTWQQCLFVSDFSSPGLWLAHCSPLLAASAPRHGRYTGQPCTSSLLQMQGRGSGGSARSYRAWVVQPRHLTDSHGSNGV